MIPSDLASRMQASAEVTLRPVAPVQEITDKLSDFVTGQRMMAEIQALLPNGTYRALVNQRNITLALPFSAKSGDALELEVVESDGKLALAVLSHRSGEAGKEEVSATISRTGQLIGRLFSRTGGEGGGGKALPLNGNLPVAEAPPGNARDILPLLKEAIAKSGMFYESHQAEWIEGRLPRTELLREPQGKLSPSTLAENPAVPASRTIVLTGTQAERPPPFVPVAESVSASVQKAAGEASPQTAGQIVAAQLQNIVHQQLEALANQTFVWHGQVWPGQDMRWEIEEDGKNSRDEDEGAAQDWRTRLDLSFPVLGGISAKLRLHDARVSLALYVNNEASLGVMRAEAETLRQRLEDAGLALASLGIAFSANESDPPWPE
jgi:hypothetical protein